VVHHPRAELLHLVHDLGLPVREVVEGEERDEGDEEPDRGGDESLGDAAGDARIIPVMVPSRPSSGAAVTIVSRAQSQRPSACSIMVASSAARDSTHHAGRAR